jgi:hypothetical protein
MVNKIYCQIEFITTLDADFGCLGISIPVILGEFKGVLILPSSDPQIARDYLAHKDLLPPEEYEQVRQKAIPSEWGMSYNHPRKNSWVDKALIIIENDVEEKFLHEAIDKWLVLFDIYYELWSPNYKRNSLNDNARKSKTKIYRIENEGEIQYIEDNLILEIQIMISKEKTSIDEKLLTKISGFASSGMFPKIEYSILHSSFIAQKNRKYREAVLEGATSLEVSLTSCVRSRLQLQNISWADSLITKYQMLSNLFKLASTIGMTFPVGYDDLIKLRNKVIHKGYTPLEDESESFLKKVNEYVQLFSSAPY